MECWGCGVLGVWSVGGVECWGLEGCGEGTGGVRGVGVMGRVLEGCGEGMGRVLGGARHRQVVGKYLYSL